MNFHCNSKITLHEYESIYITINFPLFLKSTVGLFACYQTRNSLGYEDMAGES